MIPNALDHRIGDGNDDDSGHRIGMLAIHVAAHGDNVADIFEIINIERQYGPAAGKVDAFVPQDIFVDVTEDEAPGPQILRFKTTLVHPTHPMYLPHAQSYVWPTDPGPCE